MQVKELRKAIAMAVDYDNIIENAMTNQSPSFADVPRSVMNPTDGEQALYDHDAVKDLQWVGKDIEGAKKLLDEAGIVDSDGDLATSTTRWNDANGGTDWAITPEQIVDIVGRPFGEAFPADPSVPDYVRQARNQNR
jgi:ABC-type transport system substrate-binding protein